MSLLALLCQHLMPRLRDGAGKVKDVQVQIVKPILAECRGSRNVFSQGWGMQLLHEQSVICYNSENKVLWFSLSCGSSGHEFQCSQLCY